jgi:hypothetical protein
MSDSLKSFRQLLAKVNERLLRRHPAGRPRMTVSWQQRSEHPRDIYSFGPSDGATSEELMAFASAQNHSNANICITVATPPAHVRQCTITRIFATVVTEGSSWILRASYEAEDTTPPGKTALGELPEADRLAILEDAHASVFKVLLALGHILRISRVRLTAPE